MGFKLSWVAFRGVPLEVAAETFGLATGNGRAGMPDFDASSLQLDGWSLVIFTPVNTRLAKTEEICRLSVGRDLIVVHVDESLMSVSAERWRDGARAWWVTHDSDKGGRHLDVGGTPPAELAVLTEKWFAEQDAQDAQKDDPFRVDYVFEIPVELAEQETGYRHDSSGWDMIELVSTAHTPPRMGFFQRLVSRLR